MKYQKNDFIVIPNKQIIKGMAPNMQVVFIWLCEHSDKDMISFPSRTTLAMECGLSVRTLDRCMQELVSKGLIVKSARVEDNKQRSNLYEVVIFAQGGDTVTRGGDTSAPGGATETAHRTLPIKNSTQLTQNVSKDTLSYGKPEINELFEYWESSTGLPIKSRVQANRRAAHTLFNQHGAAKLHQLIDGVVLAQGDQYAPRISDFTDLQSKLNALLVWGKQRQTNQIEVI